MMLKLESIAFKALLGAGVLIALALGVLLYGNAREADGKFLGRAECTAAIEAGNEKIKTAKRKANHETQSLDRGAIVRDLCLHGWVRSDNKCPH